MSQASTVLAHLKSKGNLSQLQALRLYGIGRLAARVKDLRDGGVEITTERRPVKTRGGRTAMVAVYKMGAAS